MLYLSGQLTKNVLKLKRSNLVSGSKSSGFLAFSAVFASSVGFACSSFGLAASWIAKYWVERGWCRDGGAGGAGGLGCCCADITSVAVVEVYLTWRYCIPTYILSEKAILGARPDQSLHIKIW